MTHTDVQTHLTADPYYIPPPSFWPVLGCLGLFTLFVGAGNWLHERWFGPYVFFLGLAVIILTLFGWFSRVIHEDHLHKFGIASDRAFRRGMMWFILSECCFFATFFGALFFTHYWSVPLLGGDYYPLTQLLLWPDFTAEWPLLSNPNNTLFTGAKASASLVGIPTLNTILLLSSGVTLTIAHGGLRHQRRGILIAFLALTVLLGLTFLGCQAYEYYHAYTVEQLTLNAGVYGSLFFLLTGFHGAHVTIGAIMLIVILGRSIAGHFTPDNHFAFQGVAWYWHFVDIVWLLLFIFVYWL